jgi:Mce-associated membrane protein
VAKKLKRDERVCPYCAETIKAAATRCRYCHSDLPPVVEPEPAPPAELQPEPKSEPKAEPKPGAEPEIEPDSGGEQPAGVWRRAVPSFEDVRSFVQRRLTLVLAALVLIAAAGVGVSWWRAEHGVSAVAPDGSLVGDDARTQVLVAAADLTQRTLSYDYKTLANDMEVARARMTPPFRKKYDATMAQVRDNTKKNKIVLEAVAVSSAIITATEHRATVLVFVNQTTTAGSDKNRNQQLNRNTLVITLTRGGGDWAMSKLTALG